MIIEGSVAIDCDRVQVWHFLTDPESVSQCAPGVDSWRVIEPDEIYEVIAVVPIGNGENQLRFPAQLAWGKKEWPQRFHLTGTVTVITYSVLVEAEVGLQAHPDDSTRLDFTIKVTMSDTSNNVARQLVANLVPKFTERFFRCAKSQLEGAPTATPLVDNSSTGDSHDSR